MRKEKEESEKEGRRGGREERGKHNDRNLDVV